MAIKPTCFLLQNNVTCPHRRSMSLQHYLNTYMRITTIKVINTPTPIYCNSLHISFTTANLFNQILITSSFPFFQKYKLQQSLLQNQPKIYRMLNIHYIVTTLFMLHCFLLLKLQIVIFPFTLKPHYFLFFFLFFLITLFYIQFNILFAYSTFIIYSFFSDLQFSLKYKIIAHYTPTTQVYYLISY